MLMWLRMFLITVVHCLLRRKILDILSYTFPEDQICATSLEKCLLFLVYILCLSPASCNILVRSEGDAVMTVFALHNKMI